MGELWDWVDVEYRENGKTQLTFLVDYMEMKMESRCADCRAEQHKKIQIIIGNGIPIRYRNLTEWNTKNGESLAHQLLKKSQ